MDLMLNLLVFLTALAGMEAVAWFSHRYVMHGWLWIWHESHHRDRQGLFEKNDLFAVIFALPSIALIWLGTHGWPLALWAGLGVAAYGVVYFVFHDVIVHRRIPHRWNPKNRYLRRIVFAHRHHHACRTKEGAVSFGFIYAPPVKVLREQMKAIEAQREMTSAG